MIITTKLTNMAIEPKQSQGITEFSGLLNTPEDSLYRICSGLYARNNGPVRPFLLFTDTIQNGRGLALMDFIVKGKFGKVAKSDTRVNPNSNRELNIFVFAPNHETLMKWYSPIEKVMKREVAALNASGNYRAATTFSVRDAQNLIAKEGSCDFKEVSVYLRTCLDKSACRTIYLLKHTIDNLSSTWPYLLVAILAVGYSVHKYRETFMNITP